MANYHILTCAELKDRVDVVFHIAVPDENNEAGTVNLRTALSQSRQAGSLVPWLESTDPAEYQQIQAGQIYEHQETVEFNAKVTTVQKRAIIDSRYGQLASRIPDKIRSVFCFWGLDRNVP